MNTPSFKGDLLVYQNEWCPGTTNGVGGITLVDVRNPSSPKKLVEGAGDFTKKDGSQSKGVPQTRANQTHSAFAWTNRETGKVYVVLVDDMEEHDVDILDITNPRKPKLVSETNLDQFAQTGPNRPHGDSVFSHDMIVKHIGNRDIMLMSYWDGGYVTLDVTNPASAASRCRTPTSRPNDPERAARGQTITPEGNGHQAEFTRDGRVLLRHRRGLRPLPRAGHVQGRPTRTARRSPPSRRRTPCDRQGTPRWAGRPSSSASRATRPPERAAARARSPSPSAAHATSR